MTYLIKCGSFISIVANFKQDVIVYIRTQEDIKAHDSGGCPHSVSDDRNSNGIYYNK